MRARVALAFPLLLAAALSGCAGGAPPEPSTTEPPRQFDDGGANRLDVPVLPSDPPAAGERTLDAAPAWRLGEHWRYHIVDGFTGNVIEATRVVAGTDGGNYLVGFPIDAFSNDVLIFHVPGVGDVAKADLSFEVHDAPFAPLRFPLRAGDTWPTAFEGRPGNMTVDAVEGGQAILSGIGVQWAFNATYDAEAGEIVRFDFPGYARYEITAHGYGYDGVVRVPHAHDLLFFHGRVGAVLGTSLEPRPDAPVTERVDIPPGYDRLAFTIILGNVLLGQAPTGQGVPAAGYYHEKATAPDGTVYELASLPSDPTIKIAFFGAGDPAGTWTLEHTAAGPGLAFIEGIGYHSIDVQLPSGCVVASANAAHHRAPCRTDAGSAGVDRPLTEA